MPAFNASKFISQSINSVLNQTFENWELLIVDDCSTDNTLEVIQKTTQADPRIKVLSTNKNSGNPGLARNIAIEHAVGEYIAFLDSDDLWCSDKLERQFLFMENNNYDLTFTHYKCIDSLGNYLNHKIYIPFFVNYHMLLKTNYIGLSTALYNCKKLGKLYFENVGHEDYLYWLNILKSNVNAYGLNSPLSLYRVHSNSISSNKFTSAFFTWKILYYNQRLGFFKAIYYFFNYIYFAIRKRFIL